MLRPVWGMPGVLWRRRLITRNQMAVEVCDTACCVHGAYGLTRDFPVEWMVRHARGMAMAAGTYEMQKVRITSEKLNRRFKQ